MPVCGTPLVSIGQSTSVSTIPIQTRYHDHVETAKGLHLSVSRSLPDADIEPMKANRIVAPLVLEQGKFTLKHSILNYVLGIIVLIFH